MDGCELLGFVVHFEDFLLFHKEYGVRFLITCRFFKVVLHAYFLEKWDVLHLNLLDLLELIIGELVSCLLPFEYE